MYLFKLPYSSLMKIGILNFEAEKLNCTEPTGLKLRTGEFNTLFKW